VIGGPEVQQMGYSFVLIPAMINAGSLVLAGVLYNGLFAWRRYPVHRMHSQAHPHPLIKKNHLIELGVEDYQFALKQLDSFIDVSPEDLAELVELAREHALSKEAAAAKANRRAARGAS
jgi:CBS-domain-containing membrane protein